MGLDVYLYHCPDRPTALAAEKQAATEVDIMWNSIDQKYDELSQDERARIRNISVGIYKKYRCNSDGQHESVTNIELPSKLYPEHLFRIGYFRSSYNAGGINSFLSKIGFPDLYEMMGIKNRDYEVHHDWALCIKNISKVIERYSAHLAGPMGRYRVMELSHPIDCASSAQDALRIFEQQLKQHKDNSFTCYSNRAGEFFLDGMRVFGFIPSSSRSTTMYVIAERELEEGAEDSYLQSLKVMRETCEYVLEQKDSENYYMVWSG